MGKTIDCLQSRLHEGEDFTVDETLVCETRVEHNDSVISGIVVTETLAIYGPGGSTPQLH